MSNITVRQTLQFPISRVWEALSDFGGIYKFHPAVRHSELLDGSKNGGVGAQRRCEFVNGRHVDEQVTAWTPSQKMDVAIVGGNMPIKTATATLSVRKVNNATTEVTMDMDYTPKMGPLGALMNLLMMKRQFRGMMQQILQGLELHLETGAVIGKGLQPQTAAAAA